VSRPSRITRTLFPTFADIFGQGVLPWRMSGLRALVRLIALALPELRPDIDWRLLRSPGHCPRCAAGHPGGYVMALFRHHHYACRRHGY
jgi:hypothetical protein